MAKYLLRRLGVSNESGFDQPHLQACLEAVLEQSAPLLEQVLVGLQAATLPVLGSRAVISGVAANRAVASLQAQGPKVHQDFATQLRKNLYGGSADVAAVQSLRFDDFQFLDAAQLDANLEIAHCQQLVSAAVEDVLPKLNAMVSNLLGWSSVQAHLNPLRPENFVSAMRSALCASVADAKPGAVVLGVASGLLGRELNVLYRELCDWLRSQGVEAVMAVPAKSTGMWRPGLGSDSTVARTMLTLDKLRKLLSGELDPQPTPADRVDFAATIPASLEALQDMKLVEPMMRRLTERASKTSPASRKAHAAEPDMLAEQADQDQRRQLGESLGREVVLLMLDNLMKDRRLLQPVRACLQALEPVLLKLAQNDGRFFSERHHPARMFLDRMTHRSLAFASESAAGFDTFQKNFESAVRVLATGSGQASSFARVLLTLEESWEREEAAQQELATQAARGLLRVEQRNMLARLHSKLLSERLVGIQVPRTVDSFLRGPWAQVIAEAQLHCTDGSEDPGRYIAFVDDLLWSVQPHLIRNNQARLVDMLPDMLLTLRRGLALISYPQPRMVAFFDTLITFQEKLLDEPDLAASAHSLSSQHSELDSLWVGEREAAESGYIDASDLDLVAAGVPLPAGADRRVWRVESLGSGAWVDLMVDGDWQRAQLHWASPQRSLFMFISGRGTAHSMSRHTLEKMKEAGRVRLVSDSRVMDKALDAVAQVALTNDLRSRNQSQG
jgi:hypothetical protein